MRKLKRLLEKLILICIFKKIYIWKAKCSLAAFYVSIVVISHIPNIFQSCLKCSVRMKTEWKLFYYIFHFRIPTLKLLKLPGVLVLEN